MVATPERIGFVTREFRSVVWSDSGVRDLYGNVARDTGDAPVETFFDDPDDARAMAEERGALLGAHARRFRVEIAAALDEAAIDMSEELPAATLIDDELAANLDVAISAIEGVDLERERTSLIVWGTL